MTSRSGPFVQRVELNARFVMNLNLSDNDLEQIAGANRREEIRRSRWIRHLVQSSAAGLVGERAAGVVRSGTRCRRPSTVGPSC